MTTVTVSAPVAKRCPYRDEVDRGVVILTFHVADHDAPELHSLAANLRLWRDTAISHEAFTREVLTRTGAASVSTNWSTADMEVTVDVSRD